MSAVALNNAKFGASYRMTTEMYKNYTLGVEMMCDVLPEATELHRAHWAETEVLYATGDVDGHYDYFQFLEMNDKFIYFTVRDDRGYLVAHLGYFLAHSIHQKTRIRATEDFFFVLLAHRKGWLALKMIRYAEKCLYGLGVQEIGMSSKAPVGGPDLDVLLRRAGYRAIAVQYGKTLSER